MASLRCFAIIALVILCMGVADQAKADLVSGPFTTTTPIPSTLTDWTGSLTFPLFDKNLGTLLSMELDLNASFTTQLTVTNSSPSGSSGTARTEVQVTVQSPLNHLSVPEIDLLSPSYSYNLAANTSVVSNVLTKSGMSSDLYTVAAVLNEFSAVGGGTIVLPASTFTQTVLSNTGGNTAASQVTNAGLTGTITYHYVATPEPSTFALLGIGAFGLLANAWRRRRVS